MASWVDDYYETVVFELHTVLKPVYRSSVSAVRYLPRIADDGDCRFAIDEDAFYQFASGTWFRLES